jgi:hypothetical protein
VGSTPTRSIFIILVDYGIILSLFQAVVGQNLDMPIAYFAEFLSFHDTSIFEKVKELCIATSIQGYVLM